MGGKLDLYRLVVLGGGGVGKTCMVIQFTGKYFSNTYDPTIEDTYRRREEIDGKSCILEILDTAGQEEYQALREQWIAGSEGAFLVYSITSRASFDYVKLVHRSILRVKEEDKFPILLVGNKSDLVTEREVSTQEGFALARELGCEFTESSAKNLKHMEQAFMDTVREVQKSRLQIQAALALSPASSSTNVNTIPEINKSRKRDSFKSIIRRFSRSEIFIPASEGNTEEGRLRLTTRLIEASRANREKEVRACIAAGAYPDGQPGVDGSALHAACASGHVNIVALLLRKGAAVNALYKGPSGISALQIASVEGYASIVRLLLHKGAQIEQPSTLHGTALCAAVSRARTDVVQILLERGARVNAVGGPYGNPLQAAAWVGSVAIVESLHRNGANINARGEGNCTALQVACYAGNVGATRSLLVRGASVDAPGGKYGSAMEAANTGGNFEVVKLLLQYGASFDTILLPSIVAVPMSQPDPPDPDLPGAPRMGTESTGFLSSNHQPDSDRRIVEMASGRPLQQDSAMITTDYRYNYVPAYQSMEDAVDG